MSKYRKKPVLVEAVQLNGNFDEIEKFVGGDADLCNGKLLIATLEGPLWASPGDYIIKGVNGEFYPCKPDVFAATYEPVIQRRLDDLGRIVIPKPVRNILGLVEGDAMEICLVEEGVLLRKIS